MKARCDQHNCLVQHLRNSDRASASASASAIYRASDTANAGGAHHRGALAGFGKAGRPGAAPGAAGWFSAVFNAFAPVVTPATI